MSGLRQELEISGIYYSKALTDNHFSKIDQKRLASMNYKPIKGHSFVSMLLAVNPDSKLFSTDDATKVLLGIGYVSFDEIMDVLGEEQYKKLADALALKFSLTIEKIESDTAVEPSSPVTQ